MWQFDLIPAVHNNKFFKEFARMKKYFDLSRYRGRANETSNGSC